MLVSSGLLIGPAANYAARNGYAKYNIAFDFPVTAIIGPNGGGKTTVLGAAAILHRSIAPRQFFSKSGNYDAEMQDWSIEYEVIDRSVSAKGSIQRTASFKNKKWNRDALARNALLFGVSRTVPASERKELIPCTSRKFSVPESRVEAFTDNVRKCISRILGKSVEGFKRLKVNASGTVSMLTGKTENGVGYSEFHFGAGESSIIKMVAAIEAAEDASLVLIEEIENGLHPVATVRLVEYLIEVAERKRIQVVLTTHSNEALKPLPDKAVWSATKDKLFQGKLDVASLRAITGQIETQGVIFVEDEFAKTWVEAILRESSKGLVDHFEVHAMAGDGTAVAMNKYHNANPAIEVPSICIIDGDSAQIEGERVLRLPGAAPESFIFDSCVDSWPSIGGKLSVALLQRFEREAEVLALCKNVRTTNMDHHLLFAQLGEKLGLVPDATVRQAFVTQWAQTNTQAVDEILARLEALGNA